MSFRFTIAGEHVSVQPAVNAKHLKELGGLTRFGGTPDTDGRSRVYGGDKNLVHVKDGQRTAFGIAVAKLVEQAIREQAIADGLRTREQAEAQAICPGCYMIVMFNALVALACNNGQSLSGLGHTMANAFHDLGQRADAGLANCREEIHVFVE